MTSKRLLDVYGELCPDDPVSPGGDDPRRDAILCEMRAVYRAKTATEAARAIAWWWIEEDGDRRAEEWVREARALMGRPFAAEDACPHCGRPMP